MSYTNKGFDVNQDTEVGILKLQIPHRKEGSNNSTPPPEYEGLVNDSPNIYVVGSGDFGRALAGRIAKSGYRVTIATRDSTRNRYILLKYLNI